jgi:hypothetical protein
MLATQDEDPFYPVLAHVGQTLANDEERLWLSFLFVAYCHLGSAWRAFHTTRTPAPLPLVAERWPFYTDRRGLRGGKLRYHVQSYLAYVTAPGQRAWLRAGWSTDPRQNYHQFWRQAQCVWGNGRWAAFKWAEVLKKVHGWPLAAPDMRLQTSTGPQAGLSHLYGLPARVSLGMLDRYSRHLHAHLAAAALPVDWETLETLLCNWHSLVRGRYYVGCDIDAQQEEIASVPPAMQAPLWAARRAVLPAAVLGEVQGWSGVRKAYLPLYAQQGILYGTVETSALSPRGSGLGQKYGAPGGPGGGPRPA